REPRERTVHARRSDSRPGLMRQLVSHEGASCAAPRGALRSHAEEEGMLREFGMVISCAFAAQLTAAPSSVSPPPAASTPSANASASSSAAAPKEDFSKWKMPPKDIGKGLVVVPDTAPGAVKM